MNSSNTTSFTNSIGMDFVRMLPGTFILKENGKMATVSKSFWLDKYPIPQHRLSFSPLCEIASG
jgi:hypothetical protein